MPEPSDFAWFGHGAYLDDTYPRIIIPLDINGSSIPALNEKSSLQPKYFNRRSPLMVNQLNRRPFGSISVNPESYLISVPNVGVIPGALGRRAWSPASQVGFYPWF